MSLVVLLGLLFAAAVGCRSKTRDVVAEVPVVPVSQPVSRDVTDYEDFTGRTDAIDTVNIIGRVTGYLRKPLFTEGSEVKKGDQLFEIDPRPYQAQYDSAKFQVELNEAQLKLAQSTFDRYKALSETTPGAVSKQALDQYQAAVDEAKARVVVQRKSLDVFQLNKEFTQVVSPIDGLASRYYQTDGNLANQDQTLLTTVVSLDPMYVYFDMDESTYLRIQEGNRAAPADEDLLLGLTVNLGLQNEAGFPHPAKINFVNNQVNATTGSITVRAIFANPRLGPAAKHSSAAGTGKADGTRSVPDTKDSSAAGAKQADGTRKAPAAGASAPGVASPARHVRRQFLPGMFVRVHLPIGEEHKGLLIIDRAIQSDQEGKYVYVVNAENKVERRKITTKALQQDGLREVDGVNADDWVVVGALQQVKAKMEVRPDRRKMPSLAGPADAAPGGAGGTKGAAR
jgi:multidrug efflux system membrane fusion protein